MEFYYGWLDFMNYDILVLSVVARDFFFFSDAHELRFISLIDRKEKKQSHLIPRLVLVFCMNAPV
jgi:hypothetical protein